LTDIRSEEVEEASMLFITAPL